MKITGIKRLIAAGLTLALLSGCGSAAEGNLFVNDYLEQNGAAPGNTQVQQPGNSSVPSAGEQNPVDVPGGTSYNFGTRGTSLSLTANKELNISRAPTELSPAPNDGIWTVFVYLCGSNLESNGGAATKDLNEMVNATAACPDLRFVIEAGGSSKWYCDECQDNMNTRLVISGGGVQTFNTETANMGDPNTLVNFLDWGLENYRSQYTMLTMWDHGGGSLSGVCMDERYYMDGIELEELDKALLYTLGNRGVKLDVFGCDACLMAAVELANICVPYADYMITSEELEPNTGWDYAGFANGINAGAKDGATLGKYICDAYYSSLNGSGSQSSSTLSVIDLSKIDQFLIAFNTYCTDIYNYMRSDYDTVLKSIGGNMIFFNNGSGWMGDMLSFIKATSAFTDKSDRAISLLEECVTYKVNGSCYLDAGGMSVFYPFKAPNTYYINIAKNLCVTPYYLGIVDAVIYGQNSMGDITGYDPDQWIDEDSGYWDDSDVDESEYDYWDGSGDDDSLNINPNQTAGLFAYAPHVEKREREVEDSVSNDTIGGQVWNFIMGSVGSMVSDEYNVYTFTFSDAGARKVSEMYVELFALSTNSEGRDVLLDVGGIYRGSGDTLLNGSLTVEEEFYGMGVGLSNGSPFSVHPISKRYVDGYGWVHMYYAPVSVNGVNKQLIFCEDYSAGTSSPPKYTAIGVMDTESDGGAPRIEPLNSGDTLRPLFPAYYADTMEFAGYFTANIAGDYVLDVDGAFGLKWYAPLPNGYYFMSYRIDDIYGNTFYTPTVECAVDHSQTYPFYMAG